jgi:hypothetical protein
LARARARLLASAIRRSASAELIARYGGSSGVMTRGEGGGETPGVAD